MQAHAPLNGDDGAFGGLQQGNRQQKRERQCRGQMHPERRRVKVFKQQGERHHDMSQNGDHDVGGEVIGAVMVEFFAANLAAVDDFQPFAKKPALAAMGAFAFDAAGEGLDEGKRGRLGHKKHIIYYFRKVIPCAGPQDRLVFIEINVIKK